MKYLTRTITTVILAASFGLASIAPASADQAAANRNTWLGIAAAIAGIAIASNVSQKNAQANTVEGYTRDGSTVFNDGHVVTPDGQSYYPGNQNESLACNGGACNIDGGNAWNGGNRRYRR
jgi:hypothetical protein